MKRWSKLKKRIEEIFNEDLGLQIHANVYKTTDKHWTYENQRIWLQCDKKIMFDFPGMFFYWKNFEERSIIEFIDEETTTLGILIDEYLETPKAELLDKHFSLDRFGFTDLLKIADRRLGKARLLEKYGHYPVGTAIGMLLRKRLKGTTCEELQPIFCKVVALEKELTGLQYLIQAKSKPTQDIFANPLELPSVRVITKALQINEPKYSFSYFPVEISSSPIVIHEHSKRIAFQVCKKDKLEEIYQWIKLNEAQLMYFWENGINLTEDEIRAWKESLKRQ